MDAIHEPEESSTPLSTPTTNEELGVLGAQAALAEKKDRPSLGTKEGPSSDWADRELREKLVGLAQQAPVDADGTLTPEAVVKRATVYFDFITGGTDGRAG